MPHVCIHHHVNKIHSNENSNISYCANCTSIILTTETKNELSTIKPSSFILPTDFDPSIITSHEEILHRSFNNKKDYLKIRQKVIRELKKINSQFSLSFQTFFLSVTYLDLICSKLTSFQYEEILLIANFCIIIAAKFSEDGCKGFEIEKEYRKTISSNYHSDEIYIVKLLDYHLNLITSYQILIMMMRIGFIFEDENFNRKKMNCVYNQMEKMLYAFVESKNYIEMTPKEIAMGIIGFARESLGLIAYDEKVRLAYGFNDSECKISFYLNGLSKITMCLKLKNEKKKEIREESKCSKEMNAIVDCVTNAIINNKKIMYAM